MKYNTSELSGALLDLAVCQAGQLWKTAHEHFPTMTLDPTFSGARIITYGDGEYCILEPNNPYRQDPQRFSPSTDWQVGGPIIERERMHVAPLFDDARWRASMAFSRQGIEGTMTEVGATPLEAAMRVYISAKVGHVVELS